MSPLKITLLLRMYARPTPNADLPQRQAFAPAMAKALADFQRLDLVKPDVILHDLFYRAPPARWEGELWLTEKGRRLVDHFLSIEPKDVP